MISPSPSVRSAEQERRKRILMWILILAGSSNIILMSLILIINGIAGAAPLPLIVLAADLAAIIGMGLLLRMGYLAASAHAFCLLLVIGTLIIGIPVASRNLSMPSLFIAIVGATLLLRPHWSFVYAGLALLGYALITIIWPDTQATVGDSIFNVVLYGVYFALVSLISYLSAAGHERLLNASLTYAQELEQARAELEARVEERTRDVRQALDDLQRSSETIRQMSVPVVPIADGVLALPLVGALDSQRAALLTERLLETVQRQHAHSVILDITGVPVVDSQVAGALLHAAQALRLLGAEPVLVGIRPEVAQTVVQLGLDLTQITTRRDMRSGLAYVLDTEQLSARQS